MELTSYVIINLNFKNKLAFEGFTRVSKRGITFYSFLLHQIYYGCQDFAKDGLRVSILKKKKNGGPTNNYKNLDNSL